MILLTAAMGQEISIVLDLCRRSERLSLPGLRAWRVSVNQTDLYLLKTGIGPRRSAARLARFLCAEHPSFILTIGYGGALDPLYSIGDLVLGTSASMLGDEAFCPEWQGDLRGTWPLATTGLDPGPDMGSRLPCHRGTLLTAAHIVGEPSVKRILRDKTSASGVDMETAALAEVASGASIPYGCVRVVSDTADATFLAPVSFDPGRSRAGRAVKILGAGQWLERLVEWKRCAADARKRLHAYVSWYLSQT